MRGAVQRGFLRISARHARAGSVRGKQIDGGTVNQGRTLVWACVQWWVGVPGCESGGGVGHNTRSCTGVTAERQCQQEPMQSACAEQGPVRGYVQRGF